jgi:speckle-type POZ protein
VSIFLANRSEGSVSATFEVKILDKLGGTKKVLRLDNLFSGVANDWKACGWSNFITRSGILDQTQNILDDDGTLVVVIAIKEDAPALKPFVPKNPFHKMVQNKFLDEETSDVRFEVSGSGVKEDGAKRSKSCVTFRAHRLILEMCAPMLAALFGSCKDGETDETATVTDVKPDIFRHLLYYVYGGSVSEEELKAHAKDIIDAADKYSIVNLKLEAEAVYVESTEIAVDNAVDNLLYADAKNCALLKEAVMDFLTENSVEASQKISFSDVPSHIIKDLLVAFGRSKNKDGGKDDGGDKFATMRVSELRRNLDERGLEVDGPREAMIEALKNNTDS